MGSHRVVKPEIIMALDLSPGCTGVAIGPTDWDGDVSRVQTFSVKTDSVKRPDGEAAWIGRLAFSASVIGLRAKVEGVSRAVFENYAWGARGAQRLGEQGFAVKNELFQQGISISLATMSAARKTLTGKGTSNKGKCHQALHAYGFRPENLDESDALVIFNHAMSELGVYCLVG